jgi:hypothetical protein
VEQPATGLKRLVAQPLGTGWSLGRQTVAMVPNSPASEHLGTASTLRQELAETVFLPPGDQRLETGSRVIPPQLVMA